MGHQQNAGHRGLMLRRRDLIASLVAPLAGRLPPARRPQNAIASPFLSLGRPFSASPILTRSGKIFARSATALRSVRRFTMWNIVDI